MHLGSYHVGYLPVGILPNRYPVILYQARGWLIPGIPHLEFFPPGYQSQCTPTARGSHFWKLPIYLPTSWGTYHLVTYHPGHRHAGYCPPAVLFSRGYFPFETIPFGYHPSGISTTRDTAACCDYACVTPFVDPPHGDHWARNTCGKCRL
jgi:hypothetical protein